MLRNRGIRTKLLAVLALPIVVLMIGAAIISAQGFERASEAGKVQLLASGSNTLGDLVQRLHQERALAVTVTNAKQDVNENKLSELKLAQTATDRSLIESRKFLTSLDLQKVSAESVSAVAQADGAHAKLQRIRAEVAKGGGQADQIGAEYSTMIANDIALPGRIGDSLKDRSIGRSLAAYSALANLVELATQETELGSVAIEQKGVDGQTGIALSAMQGVQNQSIQSFRLNAPPGQADKLDAALYQPVETRANFSTQRQDLLASVRGTEMTTTQSAWLESSTARVSSLRSLLAPLAEQTGAEAAKNASTARGQAVLLLAGGVALMGLLIGLGLVLARAMSNPLRQLTASAAELAEELPRMVERMATPGAGPGIQLPDIKVTSQDEVGQLAQAFRNVNATTVRVAEEQAALRASIAEMFVNVARRNHVLLSRQLTFIDQLERSEENPDTLDNLFRLDHLATRMRRNAESLIVLAGIDAGRRLRRPMPLSDVIRTAVSEIERYDRVDLALQADPPLVAHVALTTAHMIAELLENATQFSNPDTRVITSTAFSATGVRVTITDLGLGMTWDEITDANQRIANPPVTDVVGSQRLGFYVVGRLARRLDATVSLRPGRSQGTVVTIDLPTALFVPGTVTELPPAEVPAADRTTEARTGSSSEVGAVDERSPDGSVPDGDLPRRGAGVTVRIEPSSPVLPLPSGPDSGAESLPKRVVRDAGPVDVPEPEPAPQALPAGPRGGIFSGFRSRREVEGDVEGDLEGADEATLEAPAGSRPFKDTGRRAPLVDEEAAEFVPVLDRSTPALPTRDAGASSAPAPQSSTDATTLGDLPTGAEHQPVPDFEPVPVAELADASAVSVDPESTLPTRAGARSALSELARESTAATEPAAPGADQGATDAPPAAEPDALDQELSEAGSAAGPDVSPPVVPVPAFPPSGAPSRDILPVRGLRSRRAGRRPAKESPPSPARHAAGGPAAPVQPPAPVPGRFADPGAAAAAPASPLFGTRPGPAPAAAAPPLPAARQPMSTDSTAPVAPAAGPSAAEPLVAPSGLFRRPSDQLPAQLPEHPEPPVPTPAISPSLAAAASLRERSAMASEALSELSALSSYSPQAVDQSPPVSLQRRTPLATPAGQVAAAQPDEPIGARRGARNAADVRSMLSGFRAGVERGRTSPASHAPATDPVDE